jgi:hypothetical protein
MMALLPLLAMPIAVAWLRVGAATRALAATLATVGAGLTVVLLSVDQTVLAWNHRASNAEWLEWLSPVVNLTRAWPAFFWQESRFPLHVVIFVGIAVALWFAIRRVVTAPRTAVLLWAVVTVSVVAPVGWSFTDAIVIDPANAQLNVIRAEGEGQRVYALTTSRMARLRSLRNTMTLRPLEPGPAEDNPPPPLLIFRNAGRVTSPRSRPRQTSPWPCVSTSARQTRRGASSRCPARARSRFRL